MDLGTGTSSPHIQTSPLETVPATVLRSALEDTLESPLASGPTSRKERGAIAAQACQNCRQRKQRCNEGRPKCSTCRKHGLDCQYREAQPTKKDRTLIEILERLRSIEVKIDDIGSRDDFTSTGYTVSPAGVHHPSTPVFNSAAAMAPSSILPPGLNYGSEVNYCYVSSVSQVLKWPFFRQLIGNLKLECQPARSEHHDEIPAVRRVYHSPSPMPPNGTQPVDGGDKASLKVPFHHNSPQPTTGPHPPAIDWDMIQGLSKSYFDVYNVLHPILDRHWFTSTTMHTVTTNGFGDNTDSVLVLLVLALGEMVQSVSSDVSTLIDKDRPSGIKDGNLDQQPGLAFFNEARRRMGFALAEVNLDNVQMFALAALYLEACGHPTECWRMIMSASFACQVLITNKPDELQEPRGNLIRRVFWHCSMMETSMHMEFELHLTGLEKLADVVGQPKFSDPLCEEGFIDNQSSHVREHFGSQVVLHQLLMSMHSALGERFGSKPLQAFPGPAMFEPASDRSTLATIEQLAERLKQWRAMLPGHLCWQDDQLPPFSSLGSPDTVFPGHDLHDGFMFSTVLNEPGPGYPYAADLQVALLRTRYNYARYLVYRPFVYKALHNPAAFTQEDAEGAAECLWSCLKWPIAMSPLCLNKRIVPVAFLWSQNFFGILLLLHLSQQHPVLASVRATFGGQQFDLDAAETVVLYMNWLRDVRDMDSAATWFWSVIRVIYGVD